MTKILAEGFISLDDDYDICWFYHQVQEHAKYGVLSDELVFSEEDMGHNYLNDLACIVEMFYNPDEEHSQRRQLYDYVLAEEIDYQSDRMVVCLFWNASMVPQK